MARTTISTDGDLIQRAKDEGINVSQVAREALKETLNEPTHHLFNTNEKNLPNGQTGAGVYGHGVVATFANSNKPEDVEQYGGHIGEISAGDKIYSWQNGVGLRAVGFALEDGDSDPVPSEHRLFHSASSKIHEFHAPVHWVAVLDHSSALTPEEVKRVCDRPAYAGVTRRELNDDDYPKLLWDLVVGRANQ